MVYDTSTSSSQHAHDDALKQIKTNVPLELRERPQWVLWRYEQRGGKRTKVPYRPGGLRASSTDRDSWVTFEGASSIFERGGYDGVGFVFDGEYVGIDIDHCRNPETGQLTSDAQRIIQALASYTEVSPSGTGVHIYVSANLPEGKRGRRDQQSGVELYSAGRFFTVTGAHLVDTPREVKERQREFDSMFQSLFDLSNRIAEHESSRPSLRPSYSDVQSHEEILARLLSCEPAAAAKLGSGYGVDDNESDTDFGVVCSLLRCGASDEQVIAIMRASRLNREKFERSDYWETTTANAHRAVRASNGIRYRARTESGNAERFVDVYGDRVRYSFEGKAWLVWREKRWRWDNSGVVEKWVKQIPHLVRKEAAQLEHDAKQAGNSDRADDLGKLAEAMHTWATASESAVRMRAARELIRSEVAIDTQDLDKDPFLFNCINGTLDLRTGVLRPHNPRDLLTRLAPVAYDPGASCPGWVAFLDRVLAGNKEVIAYLQRCFGYSLTADTSEEAIFVLWGDGANGKSTLVNVISAVMGDYSRAITSDTLLTRRPHGATPELAALEGVRFAAAHETNEAGRLDEALVKAITSRDKIAARPLYSKPIEFRPTQKVWLMTNHKPDVAGRDHGIWRRLKLIPMTVCIPEEQRDKHLADGLGAEAMGILAWCVQGCLMWQREGLAEPQEVINAVSEWNNDSDAMGAFLEELCVFEPSAWTRSAMLGRVYDWYAQQYRLDPRERLSERTRVAKLRSHAIVAHRHNNARGFSGVRIKTLSEYTEWIQGKGMSDTVACNLVRSFRVDICGLTDTLQETPGGEDAA